MARGPEGRDMPSSRNLLLRLKDNLHYLLWKWRTLASRCQGGKFYDVNRTYWVSPARISQALDSAALERLSPEARLPDPPLLDRGRIVGGDWDLDTVAFEEMDVWHAFQHRFVRHRPWAETSFHARVLRTIRGGIPMWGCRSKEDLDARYREIDRLFEDIQAIGFREQREVRLDQAKPFGDEDEIQVHIGRDGDYIFADGRHRLCIARILGLSRVPVKVARRHAKWVSLRREILAYADRQSHRKIYAPILHPDLADIPSAHGHGRLEIIRAHVAPDVGTLLDIGAHWGYFCHCFEALGLQCTAVESSAVNVRFLKRLRRAERREFRVIQSSLFEVGEIGAFDVVLALNILHHFLKERRLYDCLVQFLSELEPRIMIFEPHNPEEAQMANSFRNYGPAEFARFVAETANFRSVRKIGAAEDGRLLFKLES